jgi:hypothetical protein
MKDSFEQERERMGAVTEFAGKTGPIWLERLEPELSKLPRGTFVVINCITGEYVTGGTMVEATDAFEQRFEKTIGWVHEIGGVFFSEAVLAELAGRVDVRERPLVRACGWPTKIEAILGTRLLSPHRLEIDFGRRLVNIETHQ